MADEESSVSARGVEQEGHEPQEQHQRNATDRLATLMAQYMENRREHFKKRRFDSGAGPSRPRGGGNARGRGSWRPPARPNTAQSGATGGIVCYRCGVEGHRIRDCPMPWVDKCYQCGQLGHIARHCTQGPVAASSVGSAVGGGRGANRSAQQGQATTPELRAQA
ncbi:hypothetical protein Acr_05g0015920 [Actinidia rufa]|uniref:CCHC-type domain-containing protein n=1 Tax=Actinidia rufa TaxID=165716 RepID=A0A7J0EN89_9ERIC|nr:hypothetical protein Acr_05g0015920 [Actinidia rufa]